MQLKPLTEQNEDIKLKFSQLLDQFQEYVIETEKKMDIEQYTQSEIHGKILDELNQTIKELD